MKILVFDIGGTAIKYGICQDGHLMETSECPTEAYKGGPHIDVYKRQPVSYDH